MSENYGQIPDETYLVIRDGRTSSPRTLDQLIALAEAGKLRPDDEIMQNIMGSPMPIGTAGDQPWFPRDEGAPELSADCSHDHLPSLGQVRKHGILGLGTTRWVRVGLMATTGLVLAASATLWSIRINRQHHGDGKVPETPLRDEQFRIRYASLKDEVDQFLRAPRAPHDLIQRLDEFVTDVSREVNVISRESSDLALVVGDLRAVVWNSRSRVQADLGKAQSLIARAKHCYESGSMALGDLALSDAKLLLETVSNQPPMGVEEAEYRAVATAITEAQGVKRRGQEREMARQRKEQEAVRRDTAKREAEERAAKAADAAARNAQAEAAAHMATLRWIEAHPDEYFRCLFFAVQTDFKSRESNQVGTEELFVRSFDIRRSRSGSVIQHLDYVLVATLVKVNRRGQTSDSRVFRSTATLEVYMARQGVEWSVRHVVMTEFSTDLFNRDVMESMSTGICTRQLSPANASFAAAMRGAMECATRRAAEQR
jgi:hypothetical protein